MFGLERVLSRFTMLWSQRAATNQSPSPIAPPLPTSPVTSSLAIVAEQFTPESQTAASDKMEEKEITHSQPPVTDIVTTSLLDLPCEIFNNIVISGDFDFPDLKNFALTSTRGRDLAYQPEVWARLGTQIGFRPQEHHYHVGYRQFTVFGFLRALNEKAKRESEGEIVPDFLIPTFGVRIRNQNQYPDHILQILNGPPTKEGILIVRAYRQRLQEAKDTLEFADQLIAAAKSEFPNEELIYPLSILTTGTSAEEIIAKAETGFTEMFAANKHIFGRLTKLEIKGLTSVPKELGELTTLRSLFLSRNRLTSFPTPILKLANLETLLLSCNQLESIPSEIGQLKKLKKLGLSQNILRSLPEKLGEPGCLHELEKLDISHNPLSTIHDHHRFKNMQWFESPLLLWYKPGATWF